MGKPDTLSDKNSADKIFGGQKFSADKIFGTNSKFRQFCPPKIFVRRIFVPKLCLRVIRVFTMFSKRSRKRRNNRHCILQEAIIVAISS